MEVKHKLKAKSASEVKHKLKAKSASEVKHKSSTSCSPNQAWQTLPAHHVHALPLGTKTILAAQEEATNNVDPAINAHITDEMLKHLELQGCDQSRIAESL